MVGASILLASLVAGGAAGTSANCENVLPAAYILSAVRREITARDLIELRDIGHPDANIDEASPLALSPDGRSLALVISRARTDENDYCRALVVVDLDKRRPPRIVDRGGELPIVEGVYRGMFVPTGYPTVVTPAWSPDGRWIAYLKQEKGITQLWRARADGSGAKAVTHSPVDVESWTWSGDGDRLIFKSRPSQVAANRAIDREGRSGWLYDDRITPDVTWRPQLKVADIPLETFVIEPETGEVRTATSAEAERLPSKPMAGYPGNPVAISEGGRRAWTKRAGASPVSASRIWVEDRTGDDLACPAAACEEGIRSLWWEKNGNSLLFMRSEGWNREDTALYRWRPGSSTAQLILRTKDALTGCLHNDAQLICVREDATTPRRIVAIDVDSGQSALIFDPNPQFAAIKLGQVERLRWTNDQGLPAWGDLALPPDYDGRTRLPLVIVQYRSRGFLRGGIGDDYPIHLLAAHGFAVLSFQSPPHVSYAYPNLETFDDLNAVGRKDWAQRKSLLSAVVAGVDLAIARGFVDPARIGLSGLSDGASTVAFALINTDRFAAAAISTCCTDPNTVMTYGGIAWAEWNRRVMGYPPASSDNSDFWRPRSLAVNAERIDTPLLMQLADSEAMLALETFTALREHGKPVEMYVFPGELHNKWQPAHRLAVYARNVDWFDFWLRGYVDPDPTKAEQYERWRALRDLVDKEPATGTAGP